MLRFINETPNIETKDRFIEFTHKHAFDFPKQQLYQDNESKAEMTEKQD